MVHTQKTAFQKDMKNVRTSVAILSLANTRHAVRIARGLMGLMQKAVSPKMRSGRRAKAKDRKASGRRGPLARTLAADSLSASIRHAVLTARVKVDRIIRTATND